MASIITIAGEKLFAAKAQANEQLDIDTFIFANVPGQDATDPINREEGLPTDHVVHQQIVQQVGRINDNVVVYSTVLDSITGPFEFNWVGLYSSINDTLVAINHVPTTPKTATAAGVAGNTLNRNFGIEYSGIADLTGIDVAPDTWQLDFTARLQGMDKLTQQLAADMNGKDWFIDDGFKVEPRETVNTFKILPGVGYVSGLRVELENEHIFNIENYPQFVYVDAWFEGDANSEWSPSLMFTVSDTEIDDYTDGAGIKHYVNKLAEVTAFNTVVDLRPDSESAGKAWVGDQENKQTSMLAGQLKTLTGTIQELIGTDTNGASSIQINDYPEKGKNSFFYIIQPPANGTVEYVTILNQTITISGQVYYLVNNIYNKNDPRAWGAKNQSGVNVTAFIQRMLNVGQKPYFQADIGERLDWNIYGDLEVKHEKFEVKSTRSVTLTQKKLNSRLFWSGENINHVEYRKLRLRGFGANDTASTVNSKNGTEEAQAYGIHFEGKLGFKTYRNDVQGFKNCGIRSDYASLVEHYKDFVRGTYPDEDIPDGDTGRQQFGILVYARWYAKKNESISNVNQGVAQRHGGGNIRIRGAEVGDTAIACCVFPGFDDVKIRGLKTFGRLSQHSIYAYPAEGLVISGYELTPEYQSVGIKISNNVLANRLVPRNIRVGKGLIKNTHAPAISFESFDKFADGTYSVFKSGCFFEQIEIDGPVISDYHDIGMAIQCARGRIGNVRFERQSGTLGLRPVIDLRTFSGEIHNNIAKHADRSFLAGTGSLDGAITLRNNTIEDMAKKEKAVYVSLAPAVEPMEVKALRWYAEGNLVYNPATDEVFTTYRTGFTDSILPIGAGVHECGTAAFRYFGVYSNLKTKINIYDDVYDVVGGTLADRSVSLDNENLEVKVKGVYAHNFIKKSNIRGTIRLWQGNNLQNASKVAAEYSNDAVGNGGNEYFGNSATGPIAGTYEVGDTYVNLSAISTGDTSKLRCVTRGSTGTWKVVEKIQ